MASCKFNENVAEIFKPDGLPDIAKTIKLTKLLTENPEVLKQLYKVNDLIERLGLEKGFHIGAGRDEAPGPPQRDIEQQ